MTCDKCGWWKPLCKCNGDDGPSVHVWKKRYFRDLDVNPIYVESKKQLKEECKKRNLKAACLM